MGLLVEQNARREVAGAFRVDDVGLAVVGFGFAAGAELERQRRRRREQEREGGARQIGARVADRLRLGVAGRRRGEYG